MDGPMHKQLAGGAIRRFRRRVMSTHHPRLAGPVSKRWLRHARADHWSILLGEIALYAFVVLVITGVFLTAFFDPDMKRVAYEGSYRPLRGVPVSKAYDSTLRLSFDVRAGLLMRQIHHWAALIFIAAVCFLLIRLFFTAAFRRPRGLNWLIWVVLLTLGMVAGLTGTILPDDMLSGGSLGLLQGVLQSIPVVGTHLTLWLFGGGIPGDRIIPPIYWLHIVILPAVMIVLFVLLRRLERRPRHPALPGPARSCRLGLPAARPAPSHSIFSATCWGPRLPWA